MFDSKESQQVKTCTEDKIKAQRARFLNNEIQELYWILLVTCPICWAILSTDKETNNPYCNHCQATFLPHESPDLFC